MSAICSEIPAVLFSRRDPAAEALAAWDEAVGAFRRLDAGYPFGATVSSSAWELAATRCYRRAAIRWVELAGAVGGAGLAGPLVTGEGV